MRVFVRWGLFACTPVLSLAGQTVCSSSSRIQDASKTVTAIRQQLNHVAVVEGDATVPPAVAAQLTQLKDALTNAAQAALACAPPQASAEQVQNTLAEALHANLPEGTAAETVIEEREDRKKQTQTEQGAYGAELHVQVFQLSSAPKLFEINFRYGVACGDDNLLLVFEASGANPVPGAWRERLRWDAPGYTTVGDAFGDFVLLTPLTGSVDKPVWRYLVAHGHPGCGPTPRPSTFDMDLLTPTGDPAKPLVSWHFSHPYNSGGTSPRLASTEDTFEFRLSSEQPEAPPEKEGAAPVSALQSFRFHLATNGSVEPSR